MPRCYMVKKGSGSQRHEGPPPRSPTEASVAPPCYSPAEHSAHTEPREAEYAELNTMPFSERSAADTEAAHELLSLAHSLPPLPPAAVLTVLAEPSPLVPVYTYALQPAGIYILADECSDAVTYHVAPAPAPAPAPEVLSAPEPAPMPTLQYVEPQPEVTFIYQATEETQTEFTEQDYAEPPEYANQEYVVGPDDEPEAEPEAEPLEPGEPEEQPPPHTSTPPTLPKVRREKIRRYDCSECGKRYATSSNLSRHKQTHRSLDSGSARRCGECGKAYVSMPALAMHVLTHRMGHVCGVCGKQFSRPWLLRGHLRSHTGEKPYSCGMCGKAFADRSNLRAHLQTHSSDKKYECTLCNKSFALKSYLNKHLEGGCVRDGGDD